MSNIFSRAMVALGLAAAPTPPATPTPDPTAAERAAQEQEARRRRTEPTVDTSTIRVFDDDEFRGRRVNVLFTLTSPAHADVPLKFRVRHEYTSGDAVVEEHSATVTVPVEDGGCYTIARVCLRPGGRTRLFVTPKRADGVKWLDTDGNECDGSETCVLTRNGLDESEFYAPHVPVTGDAAQFNQFLENKIGAYKPAFGVELGVVCANVLRIFLRGVGKSAWGNSVASIEARRTVQLTPELARSWGVTSKFVYSVVGKWNVAVTDMPGFVPDCHPDVVRTLCKYIAAGKVPWTYKFRSADEPPTVDELHELFMNAEPLPLAKRVHVVLIFVSGAQEPAFSSATMPMLDAIHDAFVEVVPVLNVMTNVDRISRKEVFAGAPQPENLYGISRDCAAMGTYTELAERLQKAAALLHVRAHNIVPITNLQERSPAAAPLAWRWSVIDSLWRALELADSHLAGKWRERCDNGADNPAAVAAEGANGHAHAEENGAGEPENADAAAGGPTLLMPYGGAHRA